MEGSRGREDGIWTKTEKEEDGNKKRRYDDDQKWISWCIIPLRTICGAEEELVVAWILL